MLIKSVIKMSILVAVVGCSMENNFDEKIQKIKKTDNHRELNGSDIQKTIINGSPIAPKGYNRPIVNSEKIKKSVFIQQK